jgi:hypothetical protein
MHIDLCTVKLVRVPGQLTMMSHYLLVLGHPTQRRVHFRQYNMLLYFTRPGAGIYSSSQALWGRLALWLGYLLAYYQYFLFNVDSRRYSFISSNIQTIDRQCYLERGP